MELLKTAIIVKINKVLKNYKKNWIYYARVSMNGTTTLRSTQMGDQWTLNLPNNNLLSIKYF